MGKKIIGRVAIGIIMIIVVIVGGMFFARYQREEYKNEKYGFELSFPITWKGFKTSDRTVDRLNYKTKGVETNKAIDVIYEDKPLFVIVIAPRDKWNDYNHLAEEYLGENDKYAFSYYINWEAEPDVIDRLNEVEAIGKTFKAMK